MKEQYTKKRPWEDIDYNPQSKSSGTQELRVTQQWNEWQQFQMESWQFIKGLKDKNKNKNKRYKKKNKISFTAFDASFYFNFHRSTTGLSCRVICCVEVDTKGFDSFQLSLASVIVISADSVNCRRVFFVITSHLKDKRRISMFISTALREKWHALISWARRVV
jgi:hypothetical protein